MSKSRILTCVAWVMVCLFSISCSRSIRDSFLKKDHEAALKLSPRIAEGRLDNGMRYFYMKNRHPQGRCFLRLNISIGSFVESDDELGMAHMVEHLAFDDRSISENESLAEWFQKHGMTLGPDANAETYPENTIYKIDLPNCNKETIEAALSIFRGFAHGLQFRDEAIAKEKNIIDAEEREYSDIQIQLTKKLMSKIYSGTSYPSRPVLGTVASRASFTKEKLISFYEKWYVPENLSVIVVGDFGDLKPDEMIKNAFSSLQDKKSPSKPKSPKPDHKNPFFALHEKDLAHVEGVFSIQAKTFAKPNFDKALLKERVAFDLALAMIRERYGLAFREASNMLREATIDGSFIDDGVFELTLNIAAQDSDFEERFLEAFLVINKALQQGFDGSAFESARAIYADYIEQSVVSETTLTSDIWVHRILNHVDQTAVATDAAGYHLMIAPILRDLTAQDCQTALKNALKSGNQYLYALGAIEESPATAKRLENLLRRAKTAKIDEVVNKSDVTFQYSVAECSEPDQNAPVTMPIIEAQKISLKNGIELILKPTNFKKDEVVLEIVADVGFASMNEKELNVARIAKLALLEGGLGKHTSADMMRLTKDKFFSLSLAVYDDRIQGTLNARNRDLRFAIELVRAFIIDPQYSDDALTRIKEQLKIHYAQREHVLWSPLEDQFLKALTNNDHRVGVSPLSELLKVTRDDLLAWHKKFIAEKRLKVVAVGDFDQTALGRDLSCIFQTLPAHPVTVKSEVRKLSFKSGVDQVYNVAAKDKTSLVMVRYPLDFPGKIYPDLRLQVLQNIVSEVLRIKLREKRQSAYAPSVTIAENKFPFSQNWLDIIAFTEKNQAQKLRDDVKKIMDSLRVKGITNHQLSKAKEPCITQTKKSLSENTYWASVLANNFDEAAQLKWISNMEATIRAIKIYDINQLLQKYFHVRNASSAILHPIEQ